ncbi:hypothetical protein [Nocardia mangyaensis]
MLVGVDAVADEATGPGFGTEVRWPGRRLSVPTTWENVAFGIFTT